MDTTHHCFHRLEAGQRVYQRIYVTYCIANVGWTSVLTHILYIVAHRLPSASCCKRHSYDCQGISSLGVYKYSPDLAFTEFIHDDFLGVLDTDFQYFVFAITLQESDFVALSNRA